MATALDPDLSAIYAAVIQPPAHIHPDDYHRAVAALPGLLDQAHGLPADTLDRMRADHRLASQKCTSTSQVEQTEWLHAHTRCARHFRRLYEAAQVGAE